MDGWIVHEATLRWYVLIASFGVVAVAEALAPRRVPVPRVRGRWGVNIVLTVALSVLVALAFPVLAVGAAVAARDSGLGLLNAVALPGWLAFVVAFLALDAARYGMHMLLHRAPWLWRLHRVHHSDADYDCTTALRFHPLEALVTVGAQLALITLLGAPPLAVLASEVAVAALSLFSHANLRLGPRVDAALRRILVTPDMHRVHHSTLRAESNANYGTVLAWWDRLFGTYRSQPSAGHDAMAIGLPDVRDERVGRLRWLLASPFRASST
jgi:sterol desaturase/sphingolipid hydroxylase (fatty acid hydroxylase superfamily)